MYAIYDIEGIASCRVMKWITLTVVVIMIWSYQTSSEIFMAPRENPYGSKTYHFNPVFNMIIIHNSQ